jgi:ankyrin repeat protein
LFAALHMFPVTSIKRQRDEEEEEEERKQKKLDDALLAACFKGSLDDVKKALTNGGSINTVNSFGRNGLSFACRRLVDWNVAAQIVFLLSKRCLPGLLDSQGFNAVHVAANYSSAEVMKLLLEKHASLVHSKSNEGNWTPLCLLCENRFDDEAVRVASVLLDHGANVEQVCSDFDNTPLLLACWYGRAELVSLLLQRGANVKAVTNLGLNVLHCACENGAFGKEIIPLLVKAGADVIAMMKFGSIALSYALERTYDFGKQMLKFLPAGSKPSHAWISKGDPIGTMSLHRELGKEIDSSQFAGNVEYAPEWVWAYLRSGALCFDESRKDVFNGLASQAVDLGVARARVSATSQDRRNRAAFAWSIKRADK